ncbi:Histidine transport system permease protein HisM [compost metagenome]|uniref:Histidine/lysine/arginine/ornithine transport system permease protein HisM n=1 Tax=Pseudomonas jinjuensis TaxID=198616 RepID=A0A1H0H4Q4_9PSED|nr:ABC transporter permease [Pseudomonas jinjuensis]SDO14128.1 histidine transport system permease protein [Pseudomonas jinjuensis]
MSGILGEYWQAYLWNDGLHLSGLAMTLWLLVLSVCIGFALALPLAIARVSDNPLLRGPVWLYTWLLRGTPLYLQLLLCYTGIYSLELVRGQDFLNAFFRDGLNCTILAFSLNTCAYMTEILAGAIRGTASGEVEAARAFGMSRLDIYRRIVLPSALRRALPGFSNEVILVLHSTSVAFTATVPDLLKVARDASSATYSPFWAFGIAGALYAATAFLLVWLFRKGELRWLAYLKPQVHRSSGEA